jgi:L-ascorbate metabolism protein UlaG (beta-lactamase superfamily)
MSQGKAAPARRRPRTGLVTTGVAALIVLIVAVAARQPSTQDTLPQSEGGPGVRSGGEPPTQGAPGAGSQPAANGGSQAEPEATGPDPNDLPAGHPEIVQSDPGSQVTVQWLGHACFFIHTPGGAIAVTDPFDPKSTGLPAPELNAHVVTVSSKSPDHDFTSAIGAFQGEKREVLFGQPGMVKDLRVTPIPAGDGSFAYLLEAGPMRVAHLGALKRPLGSQQLKQLGAVDILLVPAGGEGITPSEAVAMTRAIAPRLVIPMTYSTPGMEGPDARLRPLDDFIAASPYPVTTKDGDVILLSKPELPSGTEIYRLQLRSM